MSDGDYLTLTDYIQIMAPVEEQCLCIFNNLKKTAYLMYLRFIVHYVSLVISFLK
jgi:hypothetical protein